MATAEDRGWGKGWPTNRSADMARVSSSQPSGEVSVIVHKGIAALVQHAMSEAPDHGYSLHPGECWGYANRAIRGSRTPSNHSWGLAVDLNAPHNPMGDHLVTDLPPSYVALWKQLGFRWGGDYTGRKDAMHFEYMGTPHDALEAAARVHAGQQGEPDHLGSACEIPIDPPKEFIDVDLGRLSARINLDANGGWTVVPVPFDDLVSVLLRGGDDYTYDGSFHVEAHPDGTKVTLAEHGNPGWVDIVVVHIKAAPGGAGA